MKILIYDTETTGLPVWGEPSEDECQPHLVQLAAVLTDIESGDDIQSINLIIKPEGWDIPEEVSKIHGITTEQAMDVGVSECIALEMLHCIRGDWDRVAYNKSFDQRIIRIGMKRYRMDNSSDSWNEKEDHHCAMKMAREEIGGKNPKLIDAYKIICGKELINAHSAMADTLATKEIYIKLMKK